MAGYEPWLGKLTINDVQLVLKMLIVKFWLTL